MSSSCPTRPSCSSATVCRASRHVCVRALACACACVFPNTPAMHHVCVCVCARARVRSCVCVCARARACVWKALTCTNCRSCASWTKVESTLTLSRACSLSLSRSLALALSCRRPRTSPTKQGIVTVILRAVTSPRPLVVCMFVCLLVVCMCVCLYVY